MANRYELAVAITGDAKGAVNAAKLTQDELAKLAQSANQQMNKIRQSSNIAVDGFNQLKNALGGLGFVALAKQILDVNREFQTLRTSLTTVTGSAQAAEKAFKGIQAFASSTPYTVDQITESFIKLKSLGLEPSARALTAYGNTASAMGKSLNQIIEAVADASVGEFERLKEFGIKASQQADEVTFKFQGVSTTVKKSADEIQKYLKNIGEVNFAGGMVRQMNTIDGALSNLQDSFSQFYDSLLSGQNEGAIASFINTVANGVKSIDTAFVYVFGTLDTFRAYIEYAFEYAVLQVQAAFKSIVQAAMNGLADFTSTIANGAGAIGLDSLANSLRNFAVSLSAGVPASVKLEQGLAKLNEQLQREEAAISENVNSHLSYKQAMQDSNAALLDQIGGKESLIQTNNELSASEKKIADAFQSQVDSLIEQNIQLNLGERALLQYKAAQQGFNDEQQQSILALYDANKALKDHQKAQEDAAKAAEKAAEDQARAYEKAVQQAERQQQRLMNSLSRELSTTFDQLLFSGKSFTESLADMFDNMLQRMLNAAIDFASNQIIQGLFSGSWAQTLGGLAVGGLAIGASYLFGGNAPSRSDIKESRTTTSGDNRALGFMEMVASDIAARDYYYAMQIEQFKQLQQVMKTSASVIVDGVYRNVDAVMSVADDITFGVASQIKNAFSNSFISKTVDGFSESISKTLSAALGITTSASGLAVTSSGQVVSTINGIPSGISATGTLPYSPSGEFSPASVDATALSGQASTLSKAFAGLSAVVGVVTTAFNSFSLAEGWDSLSGSQRVVGVAGALGGAVSAGAGIASLAGAGALAGVLGPIGIVIALGSLLGSFFAKPKVPKISMNRLFSEWSGGMDKYNPVKGDLKYKPTEDPDILYASKQGRYATVTPLGRSTIEPRHFKFEETESIIGLLKQINAVDNYLVDTLNQIDKNKGKEALNRWGDLVGETMAEYSKIFADMGSRGEYFTMKQKAKKFDSAKVIAEMYAFTSDLLAETGTATGMAFDKWFDFFSDTFGPENTLSLVAGVTANLENLMELPLSLVDLLRDNVKAVELGGTPEDAVKEMTNVIASYSLLTAQLESLGETDFTGEQIVGFLAEMNGIGFAVEDAANSLFEYSAALKAMDLDISDGIIALLDYAKAQNLTNHQLSNYISSAGAFVTLGQALDLSAPLEDLLGFSKIVGDLAKNTLDQAELKSLEDQAVEYGGLTVTEARAEIEKLGLATADAILEVSNNLLFLNQSLEISGSSMADMSHTLLSAVEFSQAYVASFESFEDAQQFVTDFTNAIYSDFEIAGAVYRQTSQAANNLLDTLGLSGLAFDDFKAVYEEVLPTLTDPAILKVWQEAGIAIGQATAAQRQYNNMMDSLTVELLQAQGRQLEAVAIQRERELEAMAGGLQAIQAQIWAEQDLAATRERAAARLSTLADLELQILKAKGLDAQATQIERDQVLQRVEKNRQSDIEAFLQAQVSSLNLAFKQADESTLAPELEAAIKQYVMDNNLTTVQQMYDAAQAAGISVYDVGKAFGQNAEQTANILSQAGITGFEPKSSDLAGLEQIQLDYDQITNSYQELWKLQDAADQLADTSTDAAQSIEDLTQAIEDERKRLQDQIDELSLSYVEKLAKERNALFEVNRPLFDRLHLLQVEAQQHDLDIQLLEALGQSQEALAMRREDELAQMDASLHATQKAIWAAQDAAQAETDLANARNEAMSAIESAFSDLQRAVERERKKLQAQYDPLIESARENIDTLTKSVNKLKGVVDLLKNTLDSLNPVGQDNFAQRQVAQAQLRNMLAVAQGSGVLPEEEALRDTLSVLSQPSEDLFSNFIDYQRDFYQTSNNIKSLYDIADDQYSRQKSELDIAIEQLDVLEKTYTDELARLDQIIENAQAQIDAITGNTDAMLTISEALAALAEALNNFQIQFPTDGVSPTPTIGKELQTFIAQPNSTNAAAANLTLQQSSLITKLTNTSDPVEQQRIKDYASSIGVVLPGFATGGMHSGGWRIVGENGPELEYTGPSQIFSNSTSGSLLSQEEMLEELRLLREEVSEMRKENRTGQAALAASNNKTAKVLNKWDYDGLPATTT